MDVSEFWVIDKISLIFMLWVFLGCSWGFFLRESYCSNWLLHLMVFWMCPKNFDSIWMLPSSLVQQGAAT